MDAINELRKLNDQLKNMKVNSSPECTICYNGRQDKTCAKCHNGTCGVCYSKMGKCPICQDENFGAKDSSQVESEYMEGYLQNEYGDILQSQEREEIVAHEIVRARIREEARVYQAEMLERWGPVHHTSWNLNGHHFDVGPRNIRVKDTGYSIMVTVDETKKFRITKSANSRSRKHKNLQITYHHEGYEDSYLVFRTPDCVAKYLPYGDVLRMKNTN